MARIAGSDSVTAGLHAAQSFSVVPPAACTFWRVRLTISMFSVWQTMIGLPTRADSPRRSQKIAVVGAVEAEVAAFLALEVHEVLERGDAVVPDVRAQLLDVQLVGGAEVKAVVDVAARARVFLLALVDVGVGLVVEEVAEDGGDAALGRVHRLVRVLGDLLAEAEMHVRVDEARKDVQARGRLLRRAGRHRRAGREHRRDLAALHQDVLQRGRAIRKDHGAAAQYEIAHCCSCLSRSSCIE